MNNILKVFFILIYSSFSYSSEDKCYIGEHVFKDLKSMHNKKPKGLKKCKAALWYFNHDSFYSRLFYTDGIRNAAAKNGVFREKKIKFNDLKGKRVFSFKVCSKNFTSTKERDFYNDSTNYSDFYKVFGVTGSKLVERRRLGSKYRSVDFREITEPYQTLGKRDWNIYLSYDIDTWTLAYFGDDKENLKFLFTGLESTEGISNLKIKENIIQSFTHKGIDYKVEYNYIKGFGLAPYYLNFKVDGEEYYSQVMVPCDRTYLVPKKLKRDKPIKGKPNFWGVMKK